MELKKYKVSIEILAKTKSKRIFKNSNEEHAAIVLTNLVKYSNQNVMIYDNDLSGDIAKLNEDFLNELIHFITVKKNRLQILINEMGSKNNFQLKVLELLKNYSHLVDIRYANDDLKNNLVNIFEKDLFFSVGDENKFRLEYVKGRKAYCSFNNERYGKTLSNIFIEHFKNCKKINA